MTVAAVWIPIDCIESIEACRFILTLLIRTLPGVAEPLEETGCLTIEVAMKKPRNAPVEPVCGAGFLDRDDRWLK